MFCIQVVKNEVNVPVLKIFVENMYNATLDVSTKKKHNLVGLFTVLLSGFARTLS